MLHSEAELERTEPPVIMAQVERLNLLHKSVANMIERLQITGDRLLGSTPAEVTINEKETSKVRGSLNDLKTAIAELERKLSYLSNQIQRIENL